MKELLTQLIAMPSVTQDIAANKNILLYCQKWLRERGVESELLWHTDHPSLEWGASAQSAEVLICSHIDVVPAPESCFRPLIQGDKLIGRGSADTKAMVVVLMSLLAEEVLAAARRSVRFVLVSDEEIGGDTIRTLVPQMKNLKFSLFGEPTQLMLNNEAKGIMQVRITSAGKNAHGSAPWLGENAILRLSRGLESFLVDTPVPSKFTWETTFNFSQIQGGSAINQVPSSCELLCDVRFKPEDSPIEILGRLEKHFGTGSVEVIRKESPVMTDQNNIFAQLLKKTLEKQGLVTEFSRELGSSDARHCTNIGIPAIVFGPIGGALHEDGEWLSLQSLEVAQGVVHEFLASITQD